MEFENLKSDFRNPDEFYNISMSFRKLGMKFDFTQLFVVIIELVLEVILENNSAHSLVIGPVIADPFISLFGFKMTPALSKTQLPYPYSFLFHF